MFPQCLRTGTVKLASGSWSLSSASFSFAKSAAWVVFSTATILFMPVMIESERLQVQDAQKAQKNQILLGPGMAQAGGPSIGPPPI
jgi:import receptor subunit TOM22